MDTGSAASPQPAPGRPGLLRRLGAAGPFAIVYTIWPPIGGIILLATLNKTGPWLRDMGAAGILVYFLIALLLIGTSFVPTFACGALAGYAFGFAVGWPVSIAAMTAAALIAYWLGRVVARDRVLAAIHERPKWNAIHQALLAKHSGQTLAVVILLRIPPLSPYAIVNFMLAATRVPLWEFTIGTLIGIVPRMAMYSYVAAQVEQLNLGTLKNEAPRWSAIAGSVSMILACAVLGWLANRALKKVSAGAPT